MQTTVDPAIFEHLQTKIDDEGQIRDVCVLLPLQSIELSKTC